MRRTLKQRYVKKCGLCELIPLRTDVDANRIVSQSKRLQNIFDPQNIIQTQRQRWNEIRLRQCYVQIEIFLQQTLCQGAQGHAVFEVDVNIAVDALL